MDANPLIIFNKDPSEFLAYGLFCAALFALMIFRFKSVWAKRGPIIALSATLILGALSVLLLGFYFFDNRPIQQLAVGPNGIWCRSWNFWTAWPEISGMDHSYHIGGRSNGRAGWYLEFRLRDQFIGNHPWIPGVKLTKTAQCRIDDLDHGTDEVIGTVERYYENSR